MKSILALLLAINLFADTYIISQDTYQQRKESFNYINVVTTLCIDGLVFVSVERNSSSSFVVLTQVFEKGDNKMYSLPPQPKTCDKR